MEIVEVYVDHHVLDAHVLGHTVVLEIESLWQLGDKDVAKVAEH